MTAIVQISLDLTNIDEALEITEWLTAFEIMHRGEVVKSILKPV